MGVLETLVLCFQSESEQLATWGAGLAYWEQGLQLEAGLAC